MQGPPNGTVRDPEGVERIRIFNQDLHAPLDPIGRMLWRAP